LRDCTPLISRNCWPKYGLLKNEVSMDQWGFSNMIRVSLDQWVSQIWTRFPWINQVFKYEPGFLGSMSFPNMNWVSLDQWGFSNMIRVSLDQWAFQIWTGFSWIHEVSNMNGVFLGSMSFPKMNRVSMDQWGFQKWIGFLGSMRCPYKNQGRGFWTFEMSFPSFFDRVSCKDFTNENCVDQSRFVCTRKRPSKRHLETSFCQREIRPLYKTFSILKVKVTLSIVQNYCPWFPIIKRF